MAEKKVFSAITEIEVQIDASHKRRQQRQKELLKGYLQAREPLLQRRFELITGRSAPTDEELKGFSPKGVAAAAPADAKANAAGSTAGGGKGATARGVPFFWLNVLCNEEKLADMITLRDRCALEYLEDIRYLAGPMGLVLEFHFASNPYFHNKVLRKGTLIIPRSVEEGGPSGSLPPGDCGLEELMRGIQGWRDESTVIDWKPGRNLLIRPDPVVVADETAATARQRWKKGKAGAAASSGAKEGGKRDSSGGGGKKGKATKQAAKSASTVTSRSRRHHGKHSGPAPDLPDPEDLDDLDDEAEAEVADEAGDENVQGGQGAEVCHKDGRIHVVRRRPCPSFFRFFLPLAGRNIHQRKEPDPAIEDEDDEEQGDIEEQEELGGGLGVLSGSAGTLNAAAAATSCQQRQKLDSELLDVVVKRVIPRAVHLYLAGHGVPGKAPSQGRTRGGEDADAEDEGFQLVSGSPAGDIASLALGAQKALHVLMALQRQMDAMAADLKRGEWEAWVAQMKEVNKLTARRRTLLVGPTGASGEKLSIPAFWLRALRGVPYGSLLVQHRDERALSYLADIRLAWDTSRMPSAEDPHRQVDLELEFLPNPYFSNRVLRKSFTFHAPGGSLNRMWVASVKSDTIDWQPGRNLTVRVVGGLQPRGRGGDKAPSGRAARPRNVPSFFAFFDDNPGALVRAFDIRGGQSASAIQEASQAQEEFMAELINFVVQFAGSLAAESAVDVDDLGDEREDDDEEEDTDEDEYAEGEESEAAAARLAGRPAAKAARRRGAGGSNNNSTGIAVDNGGNLFWRLFSGGGGSGGIVIAIFVVIMLLAQVLVFLDTLEFVRGRFNWAA
ncbi:hypothetical protein VaNZ11_016610 [Volvox africanus]|uniref:Nucleosome assembly protein n=1 Tax=Volvox africanus TaxID=51714 RepID=A0ABQ5SNB9_9CHLO|nr:hypothetical protein VaNZ11_016610 [Volvox africanus]